MPDEAALSPFKNDHEKRVADMLDDQHILWEYSVEVWIPGKNKKREIDFVILRGIIPRTIPLSWFLSTRHCRERMVYGPPLGEPVRYLEAKKSICSKVGKEKRVVMEQKNDLLLAGKNTLIITPTTLLFYENYGFRADG